jgi:nucleoside-diphosphate-sugar epimerase
MKILIAGGNSSIARALKTILSESNEVITAGRRNCDIYMDLSEPTDTINLPSGLDVVINTAAHFGGGTKRDIYDAENINVLGTLNLCELSLKASVGHFIFISSIFSSLKEDSKQYSIYSLSKKHAEEIIKLYFKSYPLPYTILRPSQIYGNAEDFSDKQPFFYHILSKAKKGLDISFYGSNDAKRNYMHIDDLTQIISEVVKNKIAGTFDCTHINDVTYSQIAHAAYDEFKTKGVINFLKDRPDIPDNIFGKDFLLYEKIHFFPGISIEEGIKKIAGSI